MLDKVEVRTAQGNLLVLPLENVDYGIFIEEIEGLDPVKANLVSSGFAGIDGEQYQSSSREKRNLVFKLGLDPDPTVETVRQMRNRMYRFFMPKSEVFLRFFMADGLEVNISGRVESCESPMFSQEPAMALSILCFDPDFYDEDSVLINSTTSNSTSDPAGRIEVEYDGTIETGAVFTLNVDRPLAEFTIYHNDGTQVYTLDFVTPLVAGDVLTISTVTGNKFASLLRGGVTTSVLYGISPQSKWLELMPGTNLIRFYATGAAIPYSLEYRTKYGAL